MESDSESISKEEFPLEIDSNIDEESPLISGLEVNQETHQQNCPLDFSTEIKLDPQPMYTGFSELLETKEEISLNNIDPQVIVHPPNIEDGINFITPELSIKENNADDDVFMDQGELNNNLIDDCTKDFLKDYHSNDFLKRLMISQALSQINRYEIYFLMHLSILYLFYLVKNFRKT